MVCDVRCRCRLNWNWRGRIVSESLILTHCTKRRRTKKKLKKRKNGNYRIWIRIVWWMAKMHVVEKWCPHWITDKTQTIPSIDCFFFVCSFFFLRVYYMDSEFVKIIYFMRTKPIFAAINLQIFFSPVLSCILGPFLDICFNKLWLTYLFFIFSFYTFSSEILCMPRTTKIVYICLF